MTKRFLIAYAHPDDESFGNGALIAKYVQQGIDVFYICATDGDVGTIPDDMQALYPTVRELRLSELECASAVLGFKQVFTFHYKDSGMMGSETTKDPDCLWSHSQNPEQYARLVRRVVDVIREVKPQVILTFNKYGGYGHPDHIAIQRATTEAFSLAGRADYVTDAPPYQPQKLYYGSLPGLFLQVMLWMIRLQNLIRPLRGKEKIDPRRLGVNKDLDFLAVLENLEPTHARVHIADYLNEWDEASACHKSQGGGGMTRQFPNALRRLIFRSQGFTRVMPHPTQARIDETDLFDGVKDD